MKSFSDFILIALATVTLFVACADQGKTPVNKVDNIGTGDSGGGNLYKGRPIEDYRVDITTLPAYKTQIIPVLKHLNNNNQDLLRMFQTIITKRTWYMIPGELNTLQQERTGIVVPSEQGALQSTKEIWINSILFNAMSEANQGTLIMHEILMGLKILKFASNYDQCLSFTPKEEYCVGSRTELNGDIKQLTSQDYADVRATGIEIFKIINTNQSMTFHDWDDLMYRGHFSMSARELKAKSVRGEISNAELIRMYEVTKLTEQLPEYGYKSNFSQSKQFDEKCQISLTQIPENNLWELTLKAGTINKQVKLKFSDTTKFGFVRSNDLDENYWLATVSPFTNLDIKTMKLGDRHIDAKIIFDTDRWVGVEFKEMVVTKVDTDSTGRVVGNQQSSLKKGFYYLCYNQPQFRKQ